MWKALRIWTPSVSSPTALSLPLWLFGRASESRGRQTGSLTQRRCYHSIRTGPPLSPLLCFGSPGFPLLMECQKHGIMRGVNQDRENVKFTGEVGGCERDLQRVEQAARFPHLVTHGKLWRCQGNSYRSHSGNAHVNLWFPLSLLTNCTSQELFLPDV